MRYLGAKDLANGTDVNDARGPGLRLMVRPYIGYEPAAPTRSQRSSGTQSV